MEANPTAGTEVVVIGAGIVGVHSAIQFAKRGLKVVLIDNIVGQKKSFKVGESLLVFSNMFLRTISELDEFNQKCFPKHGVWFTYGMEGTTSFEEKAEWALESTLPQAMRDAFANKALLRAMADDVQIVRPEAEELMQQTARAHPNITFLDTAKVTNVVIAEGGGPHEVTWECKATQRTGVVRTTWLIDCSGRNRLLAKKLKHAAEDVELNDGFKTTAVWGQFSGIKDEMFGENWVNRTSDGARSKRDLNTLHLWGDGYWIWVIRLSEGRISVGATYDQRRPPAGAGYREKFWDIIRRYPLFDGMLSDDNMLEFHVFKNCQHITDTFVSEKRYGMIGDAASVIDAYYSQGVSLALVTSWHITNIMERDLRERRLDKEYIARVNRHTRQDWHIMRNMVIEKYTSAMADGRFFVMTHLLDMIIFVGAAFPRYLLVRWLVETQGSTARETPVMREMRRYLEENLYYSKIGSLAPEKVQKVQRGLQASLSERARWRVENGVKVTRLKAIVHAPSGLLKFWKLPLSGQREFEDISPKPVKQIPKWLAMTGEETNPRMLKMARPLMASTFFLMYGYDGLSTAVTKVRQRLERLPGAAATAETTAAGRRGEAPEPAMNGAAPVRNVLREVSA
uniref:FAD dependent halogenase n=1 Tax=Sorangium cellulosum TaxID=56 RepID=A0A0M4KXQ6_SORCE|nr:FAD dependent halogenase [Sorangium cellulosum]